MGRIANVCEDAFMGLRCHPAELNDEGICVPFFFFPKVIPYREITRVRKVSFWKAFLEGMNPFRPPLYSTGAFGSLVVIIETKTLRIALSPENADHFFRMILNRLEKEP